MNDGKRRFSFSAWSGRLALGAFCLLIGGIAASDARTTASNWTILRAASILNQGLTLDPKTVAHLRGEILAGLGTASCRSDIVHASLLMVLTDLDNQNITNNYDGWADSVSSAEKFLGHAITCLPSDGDLWLRYAMVRMKSGEIPAEQVELMQISQSLAPAEGGTLLARIGHWNELSATTLEKAAPLVNADLKNALLYMGVGSLRSQLENLSPQLTPYVAQVASQLPADRQDYFAKSEVALPQLPIVNSSSGQQQPAQLWFKPAWPGSPPIN